MHSGARTARGICQDHSRDYSGPHAGVRRDGTATPARIRLFAAGKIARLTGSAKSAVGSARRARASGDERARHPPGARFARVAYSPVRRPRVPRGPARLAPRARRATPDRRFHMPSAVNHPSGSTSFEKPQGLAFELFPVKVCISRPFGFPETERNRQNRQRGMFWFQRAITLRSRLERRDRRSSDSVETSRRALFRRSFS